jgi:hypothetical protein
MIKDDESFLEGVLAACELEVDNVAHGCYESSTFNWLRIQDPDTGECAAVLYDPEIDQITWKETFIWKDKEDFTKRFLSSLNWGEEKDEITAWAVILDDDCYANPDILDESMLRTRLEQANNALDMPFDFDQWDKKTGFTKKPG